MIMGLLSTSEFLLGGLDVYRVTLNLQEAGTRVPGSLVRCRHTLGHTYSSGVERGFGRIPDKVQEGQ